VPDLEKLALVRIQLRYPDEATFIERFAPNVTRGGIFLASRNPYPAGETLRFEVALMQGPPLLRGTGKVTWVREFDPKEPQRAHGMGVQYLALDPECKPMLSQLLERKAHPTRPAQATSSASLAIPVLALDSNDSSLKTLLQGDPSTWINQESLKLALARALILANQTPDVEALRTREPEVPVTLEKALVDLPRYLGIRR
jgi:uncharacterized protein (TIGR02266 family)